MRPIRIIVDSDLEVLFLVSAAVRGVCRHLTMCEDDAAAVELCAVEAVTNAIKHAYGGAPGNDVWIEMSYTPERLDLNIRDQGASMPERHARRLREASDVFAFDPADLQSVPEGGMGLELIRQTMDQASYSTYGGMNCLRLTKFLRAEGSKEVHA